MSQPLPMLASAFQRHGDQLYRLALLLAPTDASANAAVVASARHLAATPPATIDEEALVRGLLHTLPPEPSRRLRAPQPAWTRAATLEQTALLTQIARLPRVERAALGLTLVCGWEVEGAAHIMDRTVEALQATVQHALLAVAPLIAPDSDMAALRGDAAPPACQPVRAVLGIENAALRYDPAVRGHLALCVECRAVEQTWGQLAAATETALRGALRPIRLSAALGEQVHTILVPPAVVPVPVARTRLQHGSILVGILLLLALLVVPRSRQQPAAALGATGSGQSPAALVGGAIKHLYLPPADEQAEHPHDLWHGRWQMRWNFSASSYGTMNGDLWRAVASNQHRIQLVHTEGGGPFEFELAGTGKQIHYAVTNNYGESLYRSLFRQDLARVVFDADDQQFASMRNARLASGAWGIAHAYLEQAQQAGDLRSWGQQPGPDGTPTEIVSFTGSSPLGLPPDAPGHAAPITMLLTIGLHDGALREVRELNGPAGSEQVGQTTWRFLGSEWISAAPQINDVFNMDRAWNGTGAFTELRQPTADPALPLVFHSDVLPFATTLNDPWMWFGLPRTLPPGTAAAMLFRSNNVAANAVYTGNGRSLVIRLAPTGASASIVDAINKPDTERIDAGGRRLYLRTDVNRHYTAVVVWEAMRQNAWLEAQGYTRAELLAVIDDLGTLDLAGFQAQARVFIAPRSDAARQDLLLRMLVPAPPLTAGTTHHTQGQSFQRVIQQPDRLPDPYHQSASATLAAATTSDTWRRTANGQTEVGSTFSGSDGTLRSRWYTGGTMQWNANALEQSSAIYGPPTYQQPALDPGQTTVLHMLSCPGAVTASVLPDGTRVITASEYPWQEGTCLHPEYGQHFNPTDPAFSVPPHVYDLVKEFGQPLTTWVFLGADDTPKQIEVRVGANATGLLLESWRLLRDERLPDTHVPPGTFSTTPPPALIADDYRQPETQASTVHTATMTDAVRSAQTPLWQLRNQTHAALQWIEQGSSGSLAHASNDDVFERALEHGLVVRFRYQTTGDTPLMFHIYQGSAEQFGAYLRGQVRWQSSRPVRVQAAGRTLDGWQVVSTNGLTWTLFELDGTLLAVDKGIDVLGEDVLNDLQPVER